ncbi:MAG: dihydrolipoyl dehydrogenase [Deltaproteobacteria bacterium]|nr:dihydrolipoyl dehydrogenase [Deltaproteobacteria bacterium]
MIYDLVVIGSGPGGYVAAIRASQLGMKVALVEKYPVLGGTCLNVGCIPSKALLDSTELYDQAKKKFKDHGIQFSKTVLDWEEVLKRKEKVISDTAKGLEYLIQKNNIDVFEGIGSFKNLMEIKIKKPDGSSVLINTKRTIIATGSKPISLPQIPLDKKRVISSTRALSLRHVPQDLLVIGAGAIGLELGSVFLRAGSKVTVIEYQDRVLPNMDEDLSKEQLRCLKKSGMKFSLGQEVSGFEKTNSGLKVFTSDKKTGAKKEFEVDYCLVSVGRKANVIDLALEKIGVQMTNKGFVQVDKNLETNQTGVYAIGDVTGGAMLAHKAEDEGVFVAEKIAGLKPKMNYDAIPMVVYTWPEVASVGLTEQQLLISDTPYKKGSFSFRALGRSKAAGELDGLVKVLADQKTDRVLGLHILGARAADLIIAGVLALNKNLTAKELAECSFAHPTFSEAIKEASLDAFNKGSIHQ